MRSTDRGQTWELTTIADDKRPGATSETDIPSGTIWSKFREALGFDEAQVIETGKPGRVIAIIEESWSKDLYTCVSNDYGKSWSPPKKTGMRGNTPLLLRLKSGALACAYTLRAQDGGMRVCYSKDDGETWDTDHVTVL
ncbi:MAG: glycoside hydrolase [Acidobacteria bacterium]|nr:glycoside hydrolase [Acidobacteriota bacterium]MCI0723534.1 glycoside hydrolase [Acidobacteriota bacterium]